MDDNNDVEAMENGIIRSFHRLYVSRRTLSFETSTKLIISSETF